MKSEDINNVAMTGNIILVGMMGAGKTTVGRLLAKQLDKTFIDSDEEIQKRTGVTIAHIFDVEGEAGFRQRESSMIEELARSRDVVLATGGGAVLNPVNRENLKRSGVVIYLKSNVHDLWQRTRHDQSRPLLKTENPRARLQELFDQRDPIYSAMADIVVHTSKQSVHTLVARLKKQLESDGPEGELEQRHSMQTLNVGLAERSYPIYVGNNLLKQSELLIRHIPGKRAAIITNTTVAPLYLEKVKSSLESHGIAVLAIVLPDGEQYKNAVTLNKIYDELLAARSERNTPLIALGGGVIGDMTGYAAATYLRGVPFIQIPTTLLAQVDSSVGGKTGINHPMGKNMIGAFYQPKVVIADTSTLDTLPDRELSAGIAEVIKYGLIRDVEFFEWLERNVNRLVMREPDALQYAITRSCQNKAEVVGVDEMESGERAILNLGHTFGHAIENCMGYGVWLHGEAVAAGTMMAVDLSRRLGWLSEQDVARIGNVFAKANLRVRGPHMSVAQYQDLMGLDKKVQAGRIRFVLLQGIGKAVITDQVPPEKLHQTLEACSE